MEPCFPVLLRETNLKVKQALTVTGDLGDNIESLAAFRGKLQVQGTRKARCLHKTALPDEGTETKTLWVL